MLFSVSVITECVTVSSPTACDSQMKPRSLSGPGILRGCSCIMGHFSCHPICLVSTVYVLSVFNVETHLKTRRN